MPAEKVAVPALRPHKRCSPSWPRPRRGSRRTAALDGNKPYNATGKVLYGEIQGRFWCGDSRPDEAEVDVLVAAVMA